MKRSVVLLVAAAFVLLAGALIATTSIQPGELLATGQKAAYQADKNDGISGAVSVPDDGALKRGKPLRYKVRIDGSVKDKNTGLIWEMKCSGCGGLHDVDNVYLWSGDGSEDTIWDWLDDVNAENGVGYAGHNDWRIPNLRELQSIADYGRCWNGFGGPCVDAASINPVFGPTHPNPYWSSTTFLKDSDQGLDMATAWFVSFSIGSSGACGKSSCHPYVRAVRGGLS